jgi:predicted acetyltransferase
LLFHWANDSTVRNNAFNTDPIEYSGHCQWFANCMQRDDVQIFILVKNSALVGQVRFNIEEGKAEIDYSISSESRGKGLGNVIIRLGIEEANRMGIKELIAKVKDKNIPSQRVFLNNGFMCNEDILTFEGVKSYNYLMREPY